MVFKLIYCVLVGGFWHCENWTFVILGALHSFYLVFALITKDFRERFNKLFHFDKVPILSVFYTFILVAFAWIFFRANGVHSAFYIVKNIFTGIPDMVSRLLNHQSVFENMGLGNMDLILSVLLILFLETDHYIQSKKSLSLIFNQKPTYIRFAVYYGVILLILFIGVFENRQYIYFQF